MIIQKIFLLLVFLRLKQKREILLFFLLQQKRKKHQGLKQKFTKTVSGKIPRDSFINCLRNAAQQFVEKRGGKTLIIAGYPWFGAWGRDTFISLPGLALARHKLVLYRDVLDTQVGKMKDGLFPNMGYMQIILHLIQLMLLSGFSGLFSNILNMVVQMAGKDMVKLQNQYLNAFKNGTAFNIHMRENGLIYADAPGKALTWMDAVVNGVPVTPAERLCC